MARFRKDALYSGRWHHANGTFVCTPDEIPHYAKRLKDMVAAGLSIPLSWEHQDVGPMTAAERTAAKAKQVLGWAEDATPEGGILDVALEVPDEDDAKRLPAVRFVSPKIVHDFKDGTGRVWPGPSITHLAVTARPVQTGQKAFQRAEGATLSHTVCLSLGDYDMADEKDKKPDGDGKPGKGDKAGGADGGMGRLVAALKKYGLNIPDGADDLDKLALVVEANAPGATPGGPKPEEVTEGNAPVVMSLEAKKLVESERKGLEGRIKALKGRITVPVMDAYLARLKTVQLSLDDKAELVPNRLTIEIEALEKLQGGFGAGGTKRTAALSHEDLIEAPDTRETRRRAAETPEQAAAVLDDIDHMMGRKPA